MSDGVADIVSERARRLGPIPFDEVMELALYHPEHGFYSAGGGAGRGADFLTSPEVGPLFGRVLARALDAWWRDLGEPDPYVVVEVGAGAGTLARHVLDAGPECAPALRYVLVERCERPGVAHRARGARSSRRKPRAAAAAGCRLGALGARRSRSRADRDCRLREYDVGHGRPAVDGVGPHLPGPRTGWPSPRRPGRP